MTRPWRSSNACRRSTPRSMPWCATFEIGYAVAERPRRRPTTRCSRGERLGPLHGVPVTIKENIDQAGPADHQRRRRLQGADGRRDDARRSPTGRRPAPSSSAAPTRRPFSLRWHTDNDVHGPTLQPVEQGAHARGGSSGGAAAALAAGIAPPLPMATIMAARSAFPPIAPGLPAFAPPWAASRPTIPGAIGAGADLLTFRCNGPLARRVKDVRIGLPPCAARDARDPFWVPAHHHGGSPQRPIKVGLITEGPYAIRGRGGRAQGHTRPQCRLCGGGVSRPRSRPRARSGGSWLRRRSRTDAGDHRGSTPPTRHKAPEAVEQIPLPTITMEEDLQGLAQVPDQAPPRMVGLHGDLSADRRAGTPATCRSRSASTARTSRTRSGMCSTAQALMGTVVTCWACRRPPSRSGARRKMTRPMGCRWACRSSPSATARISRSTPPRSVEAVHGVATPIDPVW